MTMKNHGRHSEVRIQANTLFEEFGGKGRNGQRSRAVLWQARSEQSLETYTQPT
jgi:hypothetical protein